MMNRLLLCVLLLSGCESLATSQPHHYATIAVTEAEVTVRRARPEIPDSLHDRPRKNEEQAGSPPALELPHSQSAPAGAPAPLQLIPPAPASADDIRRLKTDLIHWEGLPIGEFVYADLGQPVRLAPAALEATDVDLFPLEESAPDPVHDVTARSAYYTIIYFRDASPETRAADAGAAKLVASHWPLVAIDVNKWPEFARQHCVVKGPVFVCLKGGIEIGRATTGDDPGAMVRKLYGLDAPRATGPPQASPTPAACPNGQCPNGQCPAPTQWWGRRR